MPQRDLSHNVGVVHLLDAQSIAADTYSNILDLAGFEGGMIMVNVGTFTPNGGDVTIQLEHSDTTVTGDFVAVPVADMIDISAAGDGATAGQVAVLTTTAHDNTTYIVGYKGTKRYIRVYLIEGTAITSILVAVNGLVGMARHKPESTAAPDPVTAT